MAFWETKDDKTYQVTGKILSFEIKEHSLFIKYTQGMLRIKILTAGCLRFTFTPHEGFLNIPSFAVIHEPSFRQFKTKEDQTVITVDTGRVILAINKSDSRITITDTLGCIICNDLSAGFAWTGDTIKCQKTMTPKHHFYGLGEKTGYLDKRGKKYIMWNTDDPRHLPNTDPLYKSIPFLLSFCGNQTYGIFVDNPGKINFDLGAESDEYFSFETFDREMDYYFLYGRDIQSVLSMYTDLTGKMELPPLWALGYQQCRWSYFPEKSVRELAQNFRDKDIPCDVIYLDIDYMNGYRDFTWDRGRFPDPAGLLADLVAKGFKVVTIVDPGVKKDPDYEVYMEGVKNGHFCQKLTGEIYHGEVWPGTAAFPDFTREETRRWWGEKHQALLGQGVSGIWNDMNEPSDFSIKADTRMEVTVPADVMMDNDGHPRSFARYHNIYGLAMCQAALEGFQKIKPGQRPFIVTRAAYAGIQRYSSVWTGDNHSWWEHLAMSIPMHMNIGLSGVPFVGGDVGGFQDNASQELYIRWMQLGAFTPFFRAHSAIGTKPHEPWCFGSDGENICRKYIKLRYALLLYLYTEMYQASQSGLPVMRPLVLDFPDDENTHDLCDQFMVGKSILVAPVYRPHTYQRLVYVPEGDWYNYWTDEKYTGGKNIIAEAPLDTLPLFIKGGSIIPLAPSMRYVGEIPLDTLTLEIYPGKNTVYCLYEDDGSSTNYQKGEFSLTKFALNTAGEYTLKITPEKTGYQGNRKNYVFKIHDFAFKPIQVSCKDQHTWHYDEKAKILSITLVDTRKEQEVIISTMK